MLSGLPGQTGLLADSILKELLPILIFVGISAGSAVIKMISGRSDSVKEKQDESTQKLIEMARRYKAMKEGRKPDVSSETSASLRESSRPQRDPASLSEWDRRQQQKKQKIQQRRSQSAAPRYASPQKPVATPSKPAIFSPPKAQSRPAPNRPVKPPQISQKRPPKRAAQPSAGNPSVPMPHQPPIRRPATVESPKRRTSAPTTTPAAQQKKPAGSPNTSLRSLLRNKNSLQTAILLKEILDKPIALRDI